MSEPRQVWLIEWLKKAPFGGGTEIEVVHLRSMDTFTDSQVGTEVDEWWIDVATGLPVKLVIDADLTSSVGDYIEKGTLELTSLEPVT